MYSLNVPHPDILWVKSQPDCVFNLALGQVQPSHYFSVLSFELFKQMGCMKANGEISKVWPP